MRSARSQIAIAAVALLLGFLVVAQIRGQTVGTGLENRSAQDLTLLVANLNTRNDQLRTELGSTQAELDTLVSAQQRGVTSVGQLEADLARVQAWSGLLPVSGPGVQISVSGPIPGSAVDDLIDELRNAGAEAIEVGTVRVVPASVVAGGPGSTSLENTLLPNPFIVSAIGDSETLTGSLTRAGGIVAQLTATFPDVALLVSPVARIVLPATTRDLVPNHGSPRL